MCLMQNSMQIGNHTFNAATLKEVGFDGLGCSRTTSTQTVNGQSRQVSNEDADVR
jgi:hypothetical protein